MFALNNKQSIWSAGRVLGGTSMMNAMLYIRGHKSDYDDWESLGCPGWSYQDVLPYFKRSQGFSSGDSEYHGTDGPYKVDQKQPRHQKYSEIFYNASHELGLGMGDLNGNRQDGGGDYSQVTLDRGWRRGTYNTFSKKQRAIKTVTFAHVNRILFGEGTDSDRAVGVEVERFGRILNYKVR